MGGILWCGREGSVHQRRDLLVADPARGTRTGLIEQTAAAQASKALALFPDGRLGDPEFLGDGGVAQAIGCPQDDPGPQGQGL